MPRPRKGRRVCGIPNIKTFGPVKDKNETADAVVMTVEELESLRLMDLEELDQIECAEFMGVARSTFQRIYSDARKKVADSLINGKVLKIEGGDYVVCDGSCNMEPCRHRCRYGFGHGHDGQLG